MTKPVRLRLSRRKGFSLQAHSRAVNGLPAVNVARPSRWGNPFARKRMEATIQEVKSKGIPVCRDWRSLSIETFTSLLHEDAPLRMGYPTQEEIRRHLRGKNLACWCPLDVCCHADVLLRLANKETHE